jgi:hypothetical protein
MINLISLAKSKWLDYKIKHAIESNQPVVVTFSGGLGAQILSYVLLEALRAKGVPAEPDLTYFENAPNTATTGLPGSISIWKWELDVFGIKISDIKLLNTQLGKPILRDGLLKLKLSLSSFSEIDVNKLFQFDRSDATSQNYRTTTLGSEPYMCLHLRRGDYLNVASHLVDDQRLEAAALKFKNLFAKVLILSDSHIPPDLFCTLRAYYGPHLHIIDREPDPQFSHSLMRNCDLLIGANSQFSLTAGLLSGNIQLSPKIWYSDENQDLNDELGTLSSYALIS